MAMEKEGGEEAMEDKIVFICSPYRAESQEELGDNIALARRACRYAFDSGCIPYAPHLLFPQFVSEKDEREKGLYAGLAMLEIVDEVWVIGNRITAGMAQEIAFATEHGIPTVSVIDPLVAEEHLVAAVFGGKENDEDEGNPGGIPADVPNP